MRIPGFGNVKKLGSKRMMAKATGMLQKAGIRKSIRVIKAEYYDYCDRGEPTADNKIGFLKIMKMLSDNKAAKWVDKETNKQEKIKEKEIEDE